MSLKWIIFQVSELKYGYRSVDFNSSFRSKFINKYNKSIFPGLRENPSIKGNLNHPNFGLKFSGKNIGKSELY